MSAPRAWSIIAVVAIIILGLTLIPKGSNYSTLRVDNQSFKLTNATTPDEQQRGLGYIKSLPKNQGMVFIFQSAQIQCFWMKGMEFPLDMIWLNSDKQIVHIQANVSPSTYPHNFCPLTPAQYVIELNAGEVEATNMRLNQTLQF